jgi:hypothetical protein
MIACVIPVSGREPLLWHTIQRLKRQAGPVSVVCVGLLDSERAVCEAAGAKFVPHCNHPLGEKWQYGLNCFRPFASEIEAFLLLGSSDWITDNWCGLGLEAIRAGAGVVGREEIHFLHIGEGNAKTMVRWKGYDEKARRGEFIGTGRLYSRAILDRLEWRLFDRTKNTGMDWYSLQNAMKAGAKVVAIPGDRHVHALSLSTYRWGNLHTAQGWKWLAQHPCCERVETENIGPFLSKYFPEAVNLFQE